MVYISFHMGARAQYHRPRQHSNGTSLVEAVIVIVTKCVVVSNLGSHKT